jgi:hypothetical protein
LGEVANLRLVKTSNPLATGPSIRPDNCDGSACAMLPTNHVCQVPRLILELCEAAHVPAIWATHVLQTLPRLGSLRARKSPTPRLSAPSA